MNSHKDYISQTLVLAGKGIGKTKTNPMVGALLVLHDDEKDIVIGAGYHKSYGKPHAEVEAVCDARRRGYHDFSRTTLYINLEPCCHHGKTPPCTGLIIREKIPHVVFGTKDPFPEVAGRSVRILRNHGIRVEYGFLINECRELNRAFFKVTENGLPWITLKIAQTLDGKIADNRGGSKWISSPPSRRIVHRMRSAYDAVMVGAGTVRSDNPQLNVRFVRGRQPLRVIIDGRLSAPEKSNVFQDPESQPTVVFTTGLSDVHKRKRLIRKGVSVVVMDGQKGILDLKKVCQKLVNDFQVSSVLAEGGAGLFRQLIGRRLADDVCFFTAPKILGGGLAWISGLRERTIEKAITLSDVSVQASGDDAMMTGKIRY